MKSGNCKSVVKLPVVWRSRRGGGAAGRMVVGGFVVGGVVGVLGAGRLPASCRRPVFSRDAPWCCRCVLLPVASQGHISTNSYHVVFSNDWIFRVSLTNSYYNK